MSSNTNIGNTPVNQGYVQLIHTGETGGIDGTLRTLYDGDGTASDLQIASNKVKVSTELYIGSKTATEFIQDIVGDMFTTGSYTNITTTYDDTNGNIDLSASGEVTLTGTQTLTNKTLASPTFTGTANGANLTLTGDLTVSGDTIFTNSNTVLIGDAILTLNADETGSPTANAGFEVERGTSANKTFIWNETDDKWTIGSETFVASTVEANLTGNVTGSASLNLLKSSNLSDLANVATARTNLGVDAAGTDNSTDVTLVTTSHDYLSLAGQAITLGTIDISDDTNLVGGTGITLTGDTLSTTDSEIVHDNLSGFVSNEHIDHSGVSISAGSGLTGGGDITTTRTLSVDVNNLDAQVPALELADKIAIYDNSATETNVATLTQLKAIVNTDTDTNQLTTFNVSGDSGTDQTIAHNNTLTISGGNGISTSTSATDILSVALGGFSTLIAQSSPAEQDLLVIEEAIGGAIKKVQIGALSSGISFNGSTANGLLTYGSSTTADVESELTYSGGLLDISGSLYSIIRLNETDVTNNPAWWTVADGGNYSIRLNNTGTYPFQITTNASNNAVDSITLGYSTSILGNLTLNDSLTIGSGGNYAAGSIYSDSNWGMLFRAKQASPSLAEFRWANSADSELMRIDTSGNVGIGVVSPGALLDVGGRIHLQSDGVLKWGASANAGNLTWDTGVAIVGSQSGIDLDLRAASGKNILFKIGSSEKARIDSSGNFGIGGSPEGNAKLDIKMSGVSQYLKLERSSSTGRAQIQLANESGTELWRFGLTGGGSEDFSFWDGSFNHLVFDRSANSASFGGAVTTGGQLNIEDTNAIIYRNSGQMELITYGGYNIDLNPAGDVRIDGASLYIPVAERLYFGGGNHTYISEDADDRLRFFTGGDEFMRFTQQDAGGEIFSIYQDVYLPDDKKIHFGGGNDLKIYHFNAAGDSRINVANNPLLITYNDVDRFRLASGDLVINEGGGDYNFRVEGDTDANLLFVDAGTDRVGIGVASPTAKLEVASGNSGGDAALDSPTIRINNTTQSGDWDSGDVIGTLEWYASDTSGFAPYVTSFIKSVNPQENGTLPGGYLSFGTSPYNQSGGATEEFRMEADGDFHAKQDVVAYSTTPSDKRLKSNIKEIDYGLDTILKLKPKQYDWKKDNRHDIGFIAQEVEKVIPEIVKDKKHFDKEIKTLDYEKLTAVLIKAIQEQQEQINKLEEQLNG